MKNIFLSLNDFILPFIISNVFLIRLNKHILVNYECSFLNLAFINTVFSLLGLLLNTRINNYKYETCLKLIPTSLCFSLALICLNYSLLLNTFGTYLCLQCTASIFILLANVFTISSRFNLNILFAIISIGGGFGLYLFYDINLNYYDLNIPAIVSGCIGGFVFGLYLIMMEYNLKHLESDPFKLMFNSCLVSTFILGFIQLFTVLNSFDEIKPCFKSSASMVIIMLHFSCLL